MNQRSKNLWPDDKLKNKFNSVESSFITEDVVEQNNESLEFNVFSDSPSEDFFLSNKLRREIPRDQEIIQEANEENKISFIAKLKLFFAKKETPIIEVPVQEEKIEIQNQEDLVLDEGRPSAIFIYNEIVEVVAPKVVIEKVQFKNEVPAVKDLLKETYLSSLNNIFPKILRPVEVEVGQDYSQSLLKSYLFGVEFFELTKNKLKTYQLMNGIKSVHISTAVELGNVNQIVDFELNDSAHVSWIMMFTKNILPILSKTIEGKSGEISCYSQHHLDSNSIYFSIIFSHEIIDLPVSANSQIRKQNNTQHMDV